MYLGIFYWKISFLLNFVNLFLQYQALEIENRSNAISGTNLLILFSISLFLIITKYKLQNHTNEHFSRKQIPLTKIISCTLFYIIMRYFFYEFFWLEFFCAFFM